MTTNKEAVEHFTVNFVFGAITGDETKAEKDREFILFIVDFGRNDWKKLIYGIHET